ncbi:hypothetical protein, partial [Methanosarcina mazei]
METDQYIVSTVEMVWIFKRDKSTFTNAISASKSNCGRPPHPKGWGMLRAARPVTRGQIIKHPLT